MPVYLPSSGALSTKLVSVFPGNAALGAPSHQALIAVFVCETGTPLAVMDCEVVTAMRTAAGSALATRILARAEADVLTIVGTGVQARAHAHAILRIRKIREIRVAGRNSERARALAAEFERRVGAPARAFDSIEASVAGAAVVCATTHSVDSVIRGAWLEPRTHVNSVGLNPRGRELDEEGVKKSLVVVESRQSALAPAPAGANELLWAIRDGHGLISKDHVHAEVGELISGARPGRTSQDQITVYKSVGVADGRRLTDGSSLATAKGPATALGALLAKAGGAGSPAATEIP